MSKTTNTHLLSLIVPAYKQEKTIRKDLQNIDAILAQGLPQDHDYEIICVIDGKLDKTEEEARKVKSSRVSVIAYDQNQGKGYAVRTGMKAAKGDYISFLDAGMEISPKGVMMLMAHMDWYNADIIVGSKRHPVSKVNYPFVRKILSTGYHIIVKLLFDIPVSDTQSGIKIFKSTVIKKILPKLVVNRYAMDIEMLAVASKYGFKRIYEAPIEVTFDQSTSRVRWSTSLKMAWDTVVVWYRLRIKHQY